MALDAAGMAVLVADLAAESADLDRVLAALPEQGWATPTPAVGWSVADQVVHLAHFDGTATTSAVDPERFRTEAAALVAHGDDFTEVVTRAHRGRPPAELLAWLREARAEYLRVFASLDPGTVLPWYGPPMSAASSVTARLMETWAHGQDVVDAVGATRVPTARLRSIAHLGVATRGWSHRVHGEDPPAEPVRVELAGPDGDTWTWGPADAADRVTGPALEFCLLVTQRRHRADLALATTGRAADHWLDVAQVFAGPPRARAGAVVTTTNRRPVRIANCSGFYGDRLAAAREVVEGGPIDVLTGDYLAELTMLILWKARQKDPDAGYARTFLTQLEQVLGTCLDRGIRIVSNAGGLNPAGLSAQVAVLAERLGLHPRVAHVQGDDVLPRLPELLAGGVDLAHLDTGRRLADAGVDPVCANAYLGGWGIAAALEAGADVVVTGRVTDASLVVGPAAWWHGWARTSWDALAGAVAAGHVIECGPQACGGNYSFLEEVTDRRYPGFPVAEVAADGSSVITKHEDTGGLVSVGTVTAQLLYEIDSPSYANPDVVADFASIELTQQGPDRVLLAGTRGRAPSDQLKVALNHLGGYRNTMTLVLTGLDVEEKAAWAVEELFDILGGRDSFADTDVQLLRFDSPDAPTNARATAHLRITVKDPDRRTVGRRFSNATMQLALGGYAGFHTTTPPSAESAYGVYWPALVPREQVEHVVVLPDGTARGVPHSPSGPAPTAAPAPVRAAPKAEPTRRVPLGRVVGARSGDKGGNANVGLWARDDATWEWIAATLTVDVLRELLPEADGLVVRRFELPRLRALNLVVVGLLGEGVASATRPDPQAKGLGEYLRSRTLEVPVRLLG